VEAGISFFKFLMAPVEREERKRKRKGLSDAEHASYILSPPVSRRVRNREKDERKKKRREGKG